MNFANFFRRSARVAPKPAIKKVPVKPKAPAARPPSAFSHLLLLLELEIPQWVTLNPEDQEAVDALAEQVIAAFALNNPVPSASQRVSLRVITEVAQPSVALSDVSRLVQQDPALTAAVLKVANSAAYAQSGQEIHSLRDAVTRLGATEVGRVAGMAAARTLFAAQVKQEQAYFVREFAECFDDAQITAEVAASLALKVRGAHADQVFLAGMLHDIGRSMALRCLAALTATRGTLPQWLVEAVVEKVHVELGGQTHANWDLPRFLTLVAMRHHDDNLPTDGEFIDVHVVRLASALVRAHKGKALLLEYQREIDSSAAVLGLDGFALRAIDTQIREARARRV